MPILVEGAKKGYFIQEVKQKGDQIVSVADSIKFERSKMPDGSLKFLINRRDFSKSFGPNESVKIVTPTAEYTVKPRDNFSILQGQDPSKLNTDHMDAYFQI